MRKSNDKRNKTRTSSTSQDVENINWLDIFGDNTLEWQRKALTHSEIRK